MLQTALLVAALTAPLPADTTVSMRPGDRVVVENLAGELIVEGWDRDQLELRTDDDDRDLRVRRSGDVVVVSARDGRRRRSLDVVLRVPAWTDVEVDGRSLDVSVHGIEGDVRVGVVSGEILVRDVGGWIDARTIDGEIDVQNARGGLRASSQSDDVTVRGAEGTIEVHSGSGDVLLDDVRSAAVRAETQDGDVYFSGPIEADGSYGFFVHDGDATLALPAEVDARVSVSTFDGEFHSDFPVLVQRFTGGREFEFVLGEGRARLQIEVFDGEITLRRR